ncbi:antitoxin VbhA family protein [Frankia sp. Cpl3]|nr:antitoxin VbhA family protein [Frankia sp. Cpl3]
MPALVADELVERVVRETVGSMRLSGFEPSPEAVDRFYRLARGEITADEAVAEVVASCPHRYG